MVIDLAGESEMVEAAMEVEEDKLEREKGRRVG